MIEPEMPDPQEVWVDIIRDVGGDSEVAGYFAELAQFDYLWARARGEFDDD